MANTLGVRVKKELNEDVLMLLGRAKQFLVKPLSNPELSQWWHAAIPEKIVSAYELLDKEYNIHGMTSYHHSALMPLANNILLEIRQDDLIINKANKLNVGRKLMEVWPFGPERWAAMENWLVQTAQLDFEFRTAVEVTAFLIECCGTAGQLNRGLPELVQCLPERSRNVLYDQKRASTMPYEWGPYDKEKVAIASMALAKASMMPVGNTRQNWGMSVTWATYPKKE